MPADDPTAFTGPSDASGPGAERGPAREHDPLEADFGPEPGADLPDAEPPGRGVRDDEGWERAEAFPTPGPPPSPAGLFPGVACGGDACLLKPVANLFGRFGVRLSRGHGASLSRVAFSGIELMKALRDFLDEEIALAEKAAGVGGSDAPRYQKIRVE